MLAVLIYENMFMIKEFSTLVRNMTGIMISEKLRNKIWLSLVEKLTGIEDILVGKNYSKKGME